jgi:hypothetical protein
MGWGVERTTESTLKAKCIGSRRANGTLRSAHLVLVLWGLEGYKVQRRDNPSQHGSYEMDRQRLQD